MKFLYFLATFLVGSVVSQPIAPSSVHVEHKRNLNDDFRPLLSAKREILAMLTPGQDLAVFVGDTGGKIFYTLTDQEKATYQAVLVPFSGGTAIRDEVKLPVLGREFQKNLPSFYNNVLERATKGKQYQRVVLIDSSESGKSPDGFKFVWDSLAESVPDLANKEWDFINVVDEGTTPGRPSFPMKVVYVRSTDNKLMTNIKNDKWPRVVPQYVVSVWPFTIKEMIERYMNVDEMNAVIQALSSLR